MPSIFNLFFFFLFLGLSKDIGTQCTLCVSCSSGGNVKSKSNEVYGSQIVDWCTSAALCSFLEFHVGKTKGRSNVYYLCWNIEMPLYCIVRTETATPVCTRLKSQWGAGLSRNCVWSTHAMHCFKNYVQHAKLTVLKVFQNEFILFLGFDWHRNSIHVM